MERSSNVVRLPDARDRLDHSDRETLDAILHFFTQGSSASYKDCEFTPKTMKEIRSEQEARETRSHAFVFPVSLWTVTDATERRAGRLIVIDVGKQRAFYYHPFKRS